VQSKATHLRDENDADQMALASTLAIRMCRHHHYLREDGIFSAVVVDGSDHDHIVRSRGVWEGGDCVMGKGCDDNNEGEER
jgi:hypothetical protein